MSTTFAQLQAEVAAVIGIDNTDEATNAARATKAGLRAISRCGAWEWLHTYYSTGITTVAGTYSYSLPSDLFRLDTKSIRTGGRETYLAWRREIWIDAELGPDWKDSATDNGTPAYATRVGNNLWIARKPSSSWVSSNAKLYFYYWLQEVSTGTLYLPDEFVDIAVQAAYAYWALAEQLPNADSVLARFQNIYLPELRGAKLNMNDGDTMNAPDWLSYTDDIDEVDIGAGYR